MLHHAIIPPTGLGGTVFPQETEPQEHEHKFSFKMSKDAAMRGCETCGKAWIAPRVGHALWGSWQEVGEIEDA